MSLPRHFYGMKLAYDINEDFSIYWKDGSC